MLTPWADDLDVSNVLPEYPRPQMVRDNWTNFNGVWQYAITPKDADQPAEFEGEILVPFPVESTLSGVRRRFSPDDALWYRRTFDAPSLTDGQRLLLHFGAVDWRATVWVNGMKVGEHQGGFDAFQFDVTDALTSDSEQTVVVRVEDPTNRGNQPRGKQVLEPGGIVYTAVTGIWQTVWLEQVPAAYITSIKLTPHVDTGEIEITASIVGGNRVGSDIGGLIRARIPREQGGPVRATGKAGQPFRVKVPDARLWSPDDPFLYDLELTLAVPRPGGGAEAVDTVASYFGMRQVELRRHGDGFHRIFLNGEPLFNFGPLDQGWWPDGLYTAASDDALRYDVEVTKQYGFNMCRKHVKVEPARWYYWCDKLGLLVWQDMPSGDRSISWNEPDIDRSAESEASFRTELRAMIDGLYNNPSIVVWAPFNEGWGQFKTNEILNWVKQYDPTRLVDGPSGWTDRGEGDLHDKHAYPGPAMFPPEGARASVLGEFGGLGLPLEGHLWQASGNWGYHSFDTREALASNYRQLVDNLWLLKRQGLAAAVYTQTTDVEGEVNGLMTYDRRVLKIDLDAAAEWNRRLYQPAPNVSTVVASSQEPESSGQLWRYTTSAPPDGWTEADFDDAQWQSGRAGFGTPNTPGAVVRTEWNSDEIWLRRNVTFRNEDDRRNIYLSIHHDEDTIVYLNGQPIASLTGFTTDYVAVALSTEARQAIRAGENCLAVHCKQTSGGQYVDLGFIAVESGAPRKRGVESARLQGTNVQGTNADRDQTQSRGTKPDGRTGLRTGVPQEAAIR